MGYEGTIDWVSLVMFAIPLTGYLVLLLKLSDRHYRQVLAHECGEWR